MGVGVGAGVIGVGGGASGCAKALEAKTIETSEKAKSGVDFIDAQGHKLR